MSWVRSILSLNLYRFFGRVHHHHHDDILDSLTTQNNRLAATTTESRLWANNNDDDQNMIAIVGIRVRSTIAFRFHSKVGGEVNEWPVWTARSNKPDREVICLEWWSRLYHKTARVAAPVLQNLISLVTEISPINRQWGSGVSLDYSLSGRRTGAVLKLKVRPRAPSSSIHQRVGVNLVIHKCSPLQAHLSLLLWVLVVTGWPAGWWIEPVRLADDSTNYTTPAAGHYHKTSTVSPPNQKLHWNRTKFVNSSPTLTESEGTEIPWRLRRNYPQSLLGS